MPHGYSIDVDDSETLRYSKFHKNGDKTEVQADIISTNPRQWRVNVNDPNGSLNLGKFGTKDKAKREMKEWMKSNPKGVPASDNRISGGSSGIPGRDSGVPGMDGNGLF